MQTSQSERPNQLFRNLNAKIASIPMILTAIVIFVGGTRLDGLYSFTNSKLLPRLNFVGLDQYDRLWSAPRWLISIENLLIYGVLSLIFSLVIGFLLAALLDQKIRFENTFRTIFLYPFALSFIVTGLVWQWMLNPEFGIQGVVRGLGWESFDFDPLYNPDIVIYGILIAALWQGTGLVMCLMLAGLRGIDEDIWKAARVDGIPMWKTYLFIIIPMMRPVFITTLVIIASGIVRVYDLVVAQTSGGPGIASEVPAKYVYDYMFSAQNLGQGFAASTMMLLRWRSSSCPGPISNSEARSVADCRHPAVPVAGADRRSTASRAARAEAAACVLAPQHLPLRHADLRGDLLSAAALRDGRDIAQGHAGDPARQHLFAAARDHLRALGEGLGQRLHRPQLRRAVARLLELGAHHRAVGRSCRSRSPR